MNVEQIIQQARDAMTVTRVFGEPYEKDGIAVIPAAEVRGGGGGGGGSHSGEEGGGGGFGVTARPAGAFVIENGVVRWRPAVDWYRLALFALLGLWILSRARVRVKKARAKASAS